MIPAQSTRPQAHLPQGIAELRATEVYVRVHYERVILLAADRTKPVEPLGAELSTALTACGAARVAIRPAFRCFDPDLAHAADVAADQASQRAEAELRALLSDPSSSDDDTPATPPS